MKRYCRFKTLFSVVFLALFSLTACSQAVTKSSITQTIEGKKYYIHKVEKGQSLYAIAKLYETDVNTIVQENPEAIEGIKSGQELKIPFYKSQTNVGKTNFDKEKDETYTVGKGETVYGICKKFSISDNDFYTWNPDTKSGLKEGQLVKVGTRFKNSLQAQLNSQKNQTEGNTYVVEKGETVYAICKKFNVNVEDFYSWNPETKSGVSAGQIVKIISSEPKTTINPITPEINAVTDSIIPDTVTKPKKDEYTIGLFLPFEFNETETISIDQLVKEKKDFPEMQTVAIDFYEGIKYALDSLQGKGCKYKLTIFDTQDKDSLQVDKILKNEAFTNVDMIIGPMFNSTFKVVSEKAMVENIPIVSPVTQQNRVLFRNPYTSKVTPSNVTLLEALAEYVADSFRLENVVIIDPAKPKEVSVLKTFKSYYNDYIQTKYNDTKDTLFEAKGLPGAKAAYNPNKKNYYIILSEDEVFLTDILTQLNTFIDKKKSLNVIGLKKWVSISYLDPEYLNKFNFMYPCSYFIDYNDPEIKKASLKYLSEYNVDPSDFYYQGIDVGLYYLNQLKLNGPDFYRVLDKNKAKGMIMDFNFFRPTENTGFDNRSLQIIQYTDYTFHKVN